MIDSVPLIQNPNDAQQINASIIAMKKASRELDEKIAQFNKLLSQEITNREKAITEAINSLDVASVGGSGKYISAISETDGKISATESDITSTVSSGNSQPVTSGGVADAISVPTDAVLHYSFDELPDYPDGSANVRLIDNNTYDIQNGNFQFRVFRSTTFTNSNGKLILNISADGSRSSGAYISGVYCANKIVKAKIKITALSGSIDISNGKGTNGVIVARCSSVGVYEFSLLQNPNAQYDNVYIATQNANESATIEILEIYIGDGSYSTPIIDNAKGQNNAVNNGGIAVQGVSGKGLYCPSSQVVDINGFNLMNDFTFSIWVNPQSNANNKGGLIFNTTDQFYCYNGYHTGNNYLYFVINSDSSSTTFVTTGSLLPINQFNHLVFTKSGTTVKVYLNGSLIKQQTLSFSNLNQSNTGHIGNIYNSRPQSYDDLLIFDRALTDAEVQALYLNKANTPKYYSWADWKLSNT